MFIFLRKETLYIAERLARKEEKRAIVAESCPLYIKVMQRCKLNEAKVIVSELCQILKTHVHMRHVNSDVHDRLRQLLSRLLPCIIVLRSYETVEIKIRLYEMVASVIQNVLNGTQDTVTLESAYHEELSASTVNTNSLMLISNCNNSELQSNSSNTMNKSLLYSSDYLQKRTKAKQAVRECILYHPESDEVESNVSVHTNLCNTIAESETHVHCSDKCRLDKVNCVNDAQTCSRMEERVRWDDVDGCEDAIAAIKQATIIPRHFPFFFNYNRQPWRRILLYGPPGTGKTLIARATACELNIPFLHFSSVDILSKWVGSSEKQLREVFVRAAELKRCVLFFDEIDALCGARGASGESELARRLKTEFLLHLQTTPSEVVILAATNLPWEIDSAFRRRFDRFLYIGLPTSSTRRKLICRYLEGIFNTLTLHDMEWIVSSSEQFSASDVIHLVQHAIMCPVSILVGANALRHATAKEVREYTVWCEQNTLDAAAELKSTTTRSKKSNQTRKKLSSSTAMSVQSSTPSVLTCKSAQQTWTGSKSNIKVSSEQHISLKDNVRHVKEKSHHSVSRRCSSINFQLKTHYFSNKSDKIARCKLTTNNANNHNNNMTPRLSTQCCSATNTTCGSATNTHNSKRVRAVVLNERNTVHEKWACKEEVEQNENVQSVAGVVEHVDEDNNNYDDDDDGDDVDSDAKSAAHCCDGKCDCGAFLPWEKLEHEYQFDEPCEQERELVEEKQCELCGGKVLETNSTSYNLQQRLLSDSERQVAVDERTKNDNTDIISQTYYVPCNKENDKNALPGLTFNNVAAELILLPPVTKSDFVKAFEAIVPSVTLKEMERFSQWQTHQS